MTDDRAINAAARAFAPEEVALRPRNVQFDWSAAPLHWIPGDPSASHSVTALNLFLPVAERWFSKLLSDSLVYVRDEHLREEIVGFIGQEAVHARTTTMCCRNTCGVSDRPGALHQAAGVGGRPV